MNSGKSWKEERRRQDQEDSHPGFPDSAGAWRVLSICAPSPAASPGPLRAGPPNRAPALGQRVAASIPGTRALCHVSCSVPALPALLGPQTFLLHWCSTNKVIFPHFLPLPPPSPRVISFPTRPPHQHHTQIWSCPPCTFRACDPV